MAVVIHVAPNLPKRGMSVAHPADGLSVPGPSGAPWGPQAIFMTGDPIFDDVVGHSDEKNPGVEPEILDPIDRTEFPPRAYHYVLFDHVVHLVAVLRVDACGSGIPHDVVGDQGLVGSMDGDAILS